MTTEAPTYQGLTPILFPADGRTGEYCTQATMIDELDELRIR